MRIFPALIVVAILTALVAGPILTDLSLTQYFSSIQTYLYPVLVSLLYTFSQNLPGVLMAESYPVNQINVSLWTLPVEFSAYLLTPIIVIFFKKRANLLLILLILFLSYYSITLFEYFSASLIQVPWLLTAFFLGSVFYLKKVSFNQFEQIIIASLFFAAIFFPVLVPIATTLFALAILDLALRFGVKEKKIKNDLSYGVYIISFPIQQLFVFLFSPAPVVLFLITLLFVLPLAYLSWHLIEQPALRLKPQIN